MKENSDLAQRAFRFVLIVGVVNLFADMTYEGARGIAGPFLASLGAGAALVGFAAGFGELMGYSLRAVAGFFADKTRRYWPLAISGYAINMLAVPALALTGNWPFAVALMVAERAGRAIRKPAMEAMLSHAGKSIGAGWVFGLNAALDQAGATAGPLLAALVLFLKGGYQNAFALLLAPALLCLATLLVARWFQKNPRELESKSPHFSEARGFSKAYWIYLAAGALLAAGFADFSLVAFHFKKTAAVSEEIIPVFYAAAMAADAISSLVLGRLFDKIGARVLIGAVFASAFFAPLVFLGNAALIFAGVLLWGLGMGAQDSLLKAVLATRVPPEKRGTAFGVFDAGFGIAWFLGSVAMGFLYDRSRLALVVFSLGFQFIALFVLLVAGSERNLRAFAK